MRNAVPKRRTVKTEACHYEELGKRGQKVQIPGSQETASRHDGMQAKEINIGVRSFTY
jgi:hypothetical protein